MNEITENLRLLIRAGSHNCALHVSDVVETMRPLPIEPLSGAPAGICGLCLIRGAPVPVVHLAELLGDDTPGSWTRFVSVRAGHRTVALAVDAVLGISDVPALRLRAMPPLLQSARPESIEAIGSLDAELFLVLKSASLVPADETLSSIGEEC